MATTVPKDPLRTMFAAFAGLPEFVVLWDGEPVPPVAFEDDARRLVLNVVARRKVGRDEAKRSYPDATTVRTTYKGQRVVTISVRAENFGDEEGFDLLEAIRSQVEEEAGATLNALDMSFNDSEDIRNLDAVADNRAISVAQVDLLFNQTVTRVVDKTDAGGYFDTVEMTGDPDLTIAGTFTGKGP
jgi:hypothetical protein